jgi:hypothetical protein
MELDALGKGPGGRRSSSMVETDKDVETQQSAELFDLGRCCGILLRDVAVARCVAF